MLFNKTENVFLLVLTFPNSVVPKSKLMSQLFVYVVLVVLEEAFHYNKIKQAFLIKDKVIFISNVKFKYLLKKIVHIN